MTSPLADKTGLKEKEMWMVVFNAFIREGPSHFNILTVQLLQPKYLNLIQQYLTQILEENDAITKMDLYNCEL